MMRKGIILLFVMIVMLSLLTSCLGAVSLEKYGYVLTIGIDKGKMCKYSVVFLLESESDSSEQNSSPKSNTVSAEGDNIFEAVYTAEAALPFRLNFTRTGYIVIGLDVAADDEILDFFSVSWSSLRLRTSVNLIVSGTTAQEFIEGLTYTDDVNIAKLESSLIDFYERDGLTSMMSITDFMYAVKSSRFDAVLPFGSCDSSVADDKQTDTTDGRIRTGGMISYTLGSALFSGSCMCGVLSARESRTLMLAKGQVKGSVVQFTRDDGTSFSVEISNVGKPTIKTKLEGDTVFCDYHIDVSCAMRQESSEKYADYIKKYGTMPDEMKKQVTDYLENACKTVFDECRQLNCDAFGIGKEVSRKFRTVKSWESYDFRTHLAQTECIFHVDMKIMLLEISTLYE